MKNDQFWTDDLKSVILNNAFDSIICCNPVGEGPADFSISYLNKTAIVMTGRQKEELKGKSFREVFPYSMENGLFEDMVNVFNTGVPSEKVYYYEEGEAKEWLQYSLVRYENKLISYSRNLTGLIDLERNLEKKNSELETLMMESHHRFKNNLQIIASILELEKNKLHDESLISVLDVCSSRIKSMAMVHHRLYEDMSYPKVYMKNFITELTDTVNRMYSAGKKIDVRLGVDEMTISTDEAIKIGLILNELLSNIYKYAFPGSREGIIKVVLHDERDNYSLKISDNGIGLIGNFDLAASTSTGLMLVKSFTEDLQGKVEAHCDNGTHFSFVFPKRNKQG